MDWGQKSPLKTNTPLPREKQVIHVKGIPVAHFTAGEGTPVVLLHGWGVDAAAIWVLGERLTAQGYRAYAPDMPGFGDTPSPPHAWTVYDYAQFVVAYLDALQLAQVNLIGHSFGGRLSIILGADYAQRVDKLVLIDSAGVRPPTPLQTRLRTRLYKTIRDGLYALRLRTLADELRQRYNQHYGSTDFQAVTGVMRESFVKVVNEDLQSHAKRIQASTLLIWGERDEDTPLWQAKRLEQLIPDAGLVTFPNAGHYSYLDNLPDATRIIDYFFRH